MAEWKQVTAAECLKWQKEHVGGLAGKVHRTGDMGQIAIMKFDGESNEFLICEPGKGWSKDVTPDDPACLYFIPRGDPMRKPVLRWKTRADLDAESVTVNEREYLVWHTLDGKWVSNAVRGDHPTADAAKLACEDHLATLLEPLAATYEKLRGNR